MPEEKPTTPPSLDEAGWERAKDGVPREVAAARLIVSRRIGGIPFVPYLRGDCDHAPVIRGVADFAGKVYALLDHLTDHGPEAQSEEEEAVRKAMEDFKL